MTNSIHYYNQNAAAYADASCAMSLTALHDEFLSRIPAGGHILDAGCGSGRDAGHFHRCGYRVTAFDGAQAMAELARQRTGLTVQWRTFSEVDEISCYDGIWACASLLHVPVAALPDTLLGLWRALKPGGVLYMSFKLGVAERQEEGRHFSDADEQIAQRWIDCLPAVDHSKMWRSADQRPNRQHQWLNVIVSRQSAAHQQLVSGGRQHHFLPKLCQAIKLAHQIDMTVAFVKVTGLNLLLPDLADALKRQPSARVRILTSDYLDITDPEALRKLVLLQQLGAQVRLFATQGDSFHMKAYLFAGTAVKSGQWGRAFIGSSNISRQALQDGLEWNYQIDFPPDEGYLEALSRFEELFVHPSTLALTDSWIDDYVARRKPPAPVEAGSTEQEPPPRPHDVQVQALEALDRSREEGYRRGLVVLATGLGKTWLSAFDAAQMGARRILFVAHREEILHQAAETYLRIKPAARVGYYMGQRRDVQVDVLCASVQTLGREAHLERFTPQHFDYIVIDEFHHAAAPTYRRLLNYFAPQFLLGLTATPNRTDRSDILSLCDNNLVYEFPLFDGVRGEFLVPFHYFGIYDESVDYTEIPWRNGQFDPGLLENKLATLSRARHALRAWRKHHQSRTLAFCVSRRHADFMAAQFCKVGIAAAAVHGDSQTSRGEALEQLNDGRLAVVFSVDLFNEGVDLPAIDTVLLLRPTESTILFLQQLGRGLRHCPETGKEKLVVLDFVGNHQSFLHKPQALMGQVMNHRQLADFARKVEQGRLALPDGCFINYDLAVIDFLKALDQGGAEKDYQALKETLGRRPTLTEYYQSGASLTQTRKLHGNWFGLLRDVGDLSEQEGSLLAEHQALLIEVETTAMTKSFKMILLQAFQQLGGWERAPGLAELAQASWTLLKRQPRLFAELAENVRKGDGADLAWQRYWKKNSVDHWTNKSTGLFRIEDDRLLARISPQAELREIFELMVQELIDYRLAAYEARASAKAGHYAKRKDNVVALRSDGTELPFFPTLRIACGHFRNSQAEAEEYRALGTAYGRLDPSRHFIAQASGNSMNGGKQPIQDGDYLLLEHINPDRAGSISGMTLAIERLDEVGDTQYLLRTVTKSHAGDYILKAANPAYDDIVVTPGLIDQLRTFARLRAVVNPLDMLIGQQIMREEIPTLFGTTFNPGNWHSGHVFLHDANAHVLLVTLNKQGQADAHRYVDHWIDEQTFHWQSQRKTSPESKRGGELIKHQALGQTIHLFVREHKLRDGKAAPFTYYGPVEYQNHEGSEPMSVVFRLEVLSKTQ